MLELLTEGEGIAIALAAILVLLLLSAFFSGSETALTAASDARLHQLASRGHRRAGMVRDLRSRRDTLIGAILIGNNITNVAASALATSLLIVLFGEIGVAYATLGMTALVVIFAEVLPKTYAIHHADRTALAVAPAISVVVRVLNPLSAGVRGLVIGVLRLFRIRTTAESPPDEREEVTYSISRRRRNSERVTRATAVQLTIPIANVTIASDAPTSARRNCGA